MVVLLVKSGKVTIHKTEPLPKSSSSHSRDQSSRSFSSDEDKDVCRADLTSVGGASEVPPPENLARHWTDFLKVDFHPKTVNLASAPASEPPRQLHSWRAGAVAAARFTAAARASAVCAFQRSDVIAAADALAPPRAQLCASVAQ
ncbi:hypothetical protein HPB47_001178 [Ixodes persulcatus]|uniref:Uncharacterized protein n=1 Tax=Ixodes persulcatus TaxID=34615 RepID=A0AC60PPS1_IXOPE|nr:hypothetical protein HPB47_001178 [Ixodes persulcatus]